MNEQVERKPSVKCYLNLNYYFIIIEVCKYSKKV